MRYLLFELKRSFRKTGYLIAAAALLTLICGGVISAISHTAENEPAAAPFTIAVALPENAGLHYNLAVGIISNMDSFQSMCTVVTVKSEEAALEMLETDQARAAVLIPEGLIHSVLNGGTLPARIIYPSEPSIETVLFRNLVDALAHMLASSQAGVYSLYDIYREYDADESIQTRGNTELNNLYINRILGRNSLFVREDVSSDTSASPIYHFLSGGLVLLFLLSGICLCDCLCPHAPVLSQSLSRIGIGRLFTCFAPAFGAFVTQFLLYALLFLGAFLLPPLRRFLPGLSLNFLPVLAACIFFAAAFQLFLCRIFRFREAAVIGLFLITFFMVFAAGGLLPSAFLPSAVRQTVRFNPCFYLQQALSAGLCGTFDLTSVIILLLWSILFILLSAGIETLVSYFFSSAPQKKEHAKRNAHSAVHHLHTPHNAVFDGLKHAFAWAGFLGKRTLRRPVYLGLAVFIFAAGIASQFSKPESASISVGIFCENPDAFTSTVINRLLTQTPDRLYQFYLADSRAELEENIRWGRTECGCVIPDSLLTELQQENDGSVLALSGSSSILTELILEEICAAIFEEFAPFALSDYIRETQDITISDENLKAIVDQYYPYWRASDTTFHVEYEDVDEAFFSNEAAFKIPLRGILSLLLFTAVMAGMAQYRHDKSRQLFLARHIAERHYLPVFYSLFPPLLPALAGIASLYLTGQNQEFLYELTVLIFYLAALTGFALVIGKLIHSSLIFDALIPILIIFCILYAPVITDLSTFLPAGNLLSKLAPANWYLSFF